MGRASSYGVCHVTEPRYTTHVDAPPMRGMGTLTRESVWGPVWGTVLCPRATVHNIDTPPSLYEPSRPSYIVDSWVNEFRYRLSRVTKYRRRQPASAVSGVSCWGNRRGGGNHWGPSDDVKEVKNRFSSSTFIYGAKGEIMSVFIFFLAFTLRSRNCLCFASFTWCGIGFVYVFPFN